MCFLGKELHFLKRPGFLKKNSHIGGYFTFWKADWFWQRHKVLIISHQSLHSGTSKAHE